MRQPLVHEKHLQNPKESSFLKEHKRIIREVFHDLLFPKSETFKKREAPGYVNQRAEENEPFYYENLLDSHFWDQGGHEFLFLIGGPGCGKSTILDYYLRCDCPFGNKTRGDNQERFSDYEKKLIINLDNLRAVKTEEKLEKKFFETCKSTIIEKFRSRDVNIETINDFEMWDPIFHWDDAYHISEFNKGGYSDVGSYRHSIVIPSLTTVPDQVWVECAFSFLGKYLKSPDSCFCPFQYLVIIFDNLDQSPPDVQMSAINLIENYRRIYPKETFWQIYIPLWPESYDRLFDEAGPLPPHERVFLTSPLTEILIESATNRLLENLQDEDEKIVFSRNYIAEAIQFSRDEFIRLIGDLSAYSANTKLEIWECTVSSNSLYEHYLRSKGREASSTFFGVGEYALIDGLLTGSLGFHHRRRSRHPVCNPFFVVDNPTGPRDALIGLHLLWYFSKIRNFVPYNQISIDFKALGYSSHRIREALDELRKYGLVRFFTEYNEPRILVQPRVVESYFRLFHQNAYIDDLAMTSPIENRSGMAVTRSFVPEEFVKRTRTTFRFLENLYADEESFRDPFQGSNLPSDSLQNAFRHTLRKSGITTFSKMISESYVSNLEAFKRTGRLASVVNEGEWNSLFNNKPLKLCLNAPSTLLPKESPN